MIRDQPTMNNDSALIDTLKAIPPVVGGITLQHVHFADQLLTFATHLVGFCAAVVGLVWYWVRLQKDLKKRK